MKKTKARTRKKGQPAKRWLSFFRMKPRQSSARRTKKPSRQPGVFKQTLMKISRRRVYLAISQSPNPKREIIFPFIGFITFPFAFIVIGQQPLRGRPKKARGLSLGFKPRRSWKASPAVLAALIAGIIGTAYFGLALARPTYSTPTFHTPANNIQVAPVSPQAKPHLSKSLPVSISAPDVGLSGQFIQVGRAADNTLETPPDYVTVGWYKDSPTPGEIGPAIAVGHVDSYKGPGVFWNLRNMLPGQIIEITREDKSVAKFKVDSVEQFMQDAFPTARVYGAIDYAGLRLITCGGDFSHQTLEYNQNTIVFASFVE